MIKKFKDFINEEFSLVGSMGPTYGKQEIPNTINKSHTNIILSDIDNKFYTQDDYENLHNEYLKKGGKPLSGFSKENIELILTKINQ